MSARQRGPRASKLTDGDPAITPAKLYRLDKSNGAATFVGNVGFNGVAGIAFLTPIPEPGTYLLLLSGCVLLSIRVRAHANAAMRPRAGQDRSGGLGIGPSVW